MILVTGAAGLIGSAVVRALNERGLDQIYLVDHLGRSEKWQNLRSLRYSRYFERDEFRRLVRAALDSDQSALTDFWLEVDTIIHLGANSATTEKDASHLMDNNYLYSIEMSELATKLNARFVYASSAATYGDGSHGFVDRMDDYLDQLRPLNAYGYSKHAFDLYMRQNKSASSFAGLKYFNVFGPNEYHKADMRSVVHKAFEQIQSDSRLKLFKSYHPDYADGEQKRDFLYVKDAAEMTLHLALDARSATGLFNIGSGQAQTWLELAEHIFAAIGQPRQIDFIEMPEHIKAKYQYYTCAPLDRLHQSGYQKPPTTLQDAVFDYIQNYLLEPDPYA